MKYRCLLLFIIVLTTITAYSQDAAIYTALDTINLILKDSPMKMIFDGSEYISVENSNVVKNYKIEEFNFSLKQVEEIIYEEEVNYSVLKLICLLAEKPCFSDSDSTNGVRYLPLPPNPSNKRVAQELMFIKSRL